jgi:hypothetical protein
MKPRCAVLILLAWPLRIAASQVSLSASTQMATIAEHIELRVLVNAELSVQSVRVQVPSGAYEVIGRSVRPVVRSGEGRTFEEIITIAFFQTGDFVVGPFSVELLPKRDGSTSEWTGQLAIRVRSVLGEQDKDIKPLKELLAIRGDPRHLLPYAAAFLLLALVALVFLLLLKRLKRKRQPQASPPLPPDIELEARVQDLRKSNLLPAGEFRRFFIALSEMIKHFIQRAYGFNAEECTSAETVAQLKNHERDGEIIAHLQAIFEQSDLVKFARRVPAQEEVAGIWPLIADLVATHRKRREQAVEEVDVQPGR